MISCNSIGTNGRLGNQMFQAAATIGIALNLGFKYQFSPGRLKEVFTLDGLEEVEQQIPYHFWNEKKFSYEKIVEKLNSNTEIFGYFQTSKYWNNVKDIIVKAFTVKSEFIEKIPESLKIFCDTATSLHLRRTDYLEKPDFHPTFDISKYKSLLRPEERIALFTDDVEYGRYFLASLIDAGCSKESLLVSDQKLSDVQEFYLMTLCSRAIIANSSFSWWAAYLGPHQRGQEVNAPLQWFGRSGPQDIHDLYENAWIKF